MVDKILKSPEEAHAVVDATINKSNNVVKAIVMKALLRIKEAHQKNHNKGSLQLLLRLYINVFAESFAFEGSAFH